MKIGFYIIMLALTRRFKLYNDKTNIQSENEGKTTTELEKA